MEWIKKGLLYCPDSNVWWSKQYAMYPTPYFMESQNKIRIFFGTLDAQNFGRTSFIDVDADAPEKIVYNPNKFILDLGIKGTFDDCGATPACAININNKLHLYYSGFSRSYQSPYQIFSGLATSNDGENYQRYSNVPVLERSNLEYFDRAGQTIVYDNGEYKSWYVSGVKWETLNTSLYKNKQMPVHIVRYASSKDGLKWASVDKPCIDIGEEEEFGFGRPWVYKDGSLFKMWYSIRRKNYPYRMGYAESENGLDWIRKDNEVGIQTSSSGWDSEMLCYGAVIKVKNKILMFYNGNNHGATGFGLAELK